MKKILSILVLFLSIKSFSQEPVNYIPQNSYHKFRGLYPDSVLHIPTGCGTPSLLTTKSWKGGAALYGDTCNNRLYLYSDTSWIRIAKFDEAGAGSGIIELGDSPYGLIKVNDSTYRVDTSWGGGLETKINNRRMQDSTNSNIALKFNTSDTANKWLYDVYRKPGTDSVFKGRGGTYTFAYRDTLGAGGGIGTLDTIPNPRWYVTSDAAGTLWKTHAPFKVWNIMDLGAERDTSFNSAPAIRRAIDSVIANKGGIVLIPSGMFRVDSLLLPAYAGPEQIQIVIQGQEPPTFLYGTVFYAYTYPTSGSIIYSRYGSPTAAILKALPLSGTFSFLSTIIDNVDFRSYENPNISGVDLSYSPFARVENTSINTWKYSVSTAQPTNGKFGLKMPLNNNGAYSIVNNVQITGYDTAVVAHEHLKMDNAHIYGVKYAIWPANPFGPHSWNIGKLSSAGVRYGIYNTGATNLKIELWDHENLDSTTQAGLGQTWQNTWAHIVDDNNEMHSEITYYITGANGSDNSWKQVGGRYVRAVRLGRWLDSMVIGTQNPTTTKPALNIEKANNDFGVTSYPGIRIYNTHTTTGTGNFGDIAFGSGNGTVTGGIGSNFGAASTAPYSSGSGMYIGSYSAHPIKFYTNSGIKFEIASNGAFTVNGSAGNSGDVLKSTGGGATAWAAPDITGTTGNTDNKVIVSDGVTGGVIKPSPVTIDPSGNMTNVQDLTTLGFVSGGTYVAAPMLYGGNKTSQTYSGYDGLVVGNTAKRAIIAFWDNNIQTAQQYTDNDNLNFYGLASKGFQFYTNNSSTTALLKLSNTDQRVGINTNSPQKVFHTSGTVRMASLGTASSDTTTYKPLGIDANGDVFPMTYWPGSGGGGGGYTNLTQFVDQTAWRTFYSNGSGDVTELSLGASNTVLLGNGVTSAPSWGTVPNAALTNSTISGISLGSNLADLTALNTTLTFSGAYNGSTARTIGLNLGNANTWTADQTVPDEVYDATNWNGNLEVPTKNAIRDYVEGLPTLDSVVTDINVLKWDGTNWLSKALIDNTDIDFQRGDAGDTTITATIKNDAVTFAKFQNVTDARLLGRSAGSSGDMQELTVSAPITLSGGVLDFDESANLGNNARVSVNKNSGATVGTRRRINFIEGSNVTLTISDDSGNEEVDVTIASTGGSGSPGGSNTQFQYNNSGAFAGSGNMVQGTNQISISGTGSQVPLLVTGHEDNGKGAIIQVKEFNGGTIAELRQDTTFSQRYYSGTPTTPSANFGLLYWKNDSLRSINDNGIEKNLWASGGGADSVAYSFMQQPNDSMLIMKKTYAAEGDTIVFRFPQYAEITISPSQLTADQDNWNPTNWDNATIVRLSGDATIRAITSFAAPTASTKPYKKKLINTGSSPVYIPTEHPDGTAANRVDYVSDYVIYPKQTVNIIYDATSSRWRIEGENNIFVKKGISFSIGAGSITAADHGELAFAQTGTGAAAAASAATTSLPASYSLGTGTTTTGLASLYFTKSANTFSAFAAAHIYAEAVVYIPTLSDGTETHTSYLLITNSPSGTTAEPNNSVFIRYSNGINSGKWQLVSQDNAGAESTADLGS